MGTKYGKLEDYEPFTIDTKKEHWREACCDCGLVHDVIMRVDAKNRDRILIYLVRHDRATAQLRRHKYGYLQHTNGNRYLMVREVGDE